MHRNLLAYARGRYFWIAVVLLLGSILVYASQPARLPPNGGSWQGYTLGGLATALVLWLSWLGIRKRSYRSTLGTVQGWTSAHVWLGLAVLPISLFHAAFQVGWNVHTLAFALLLIVVLSGIYGLFAYLALPQRLAATYGGRDREAWLTELNQVDARLRELAHEADPRTRSVVESAIDRTTLGGGALAQLFGRDRSVLLDPGETQGVARTLENRGQARLVDYLAARVPQAERRGEAALLQELLGLASRRRRILDTLRQGVRLQARIQAWLYLHVPLTVGLLAALSVHILVVFFYW
jgi:hypothetical protein